jgi:cytoskeletal protein CcmA (bactofilin family)
MSAAAVFGGPTAVIGKSVVIKGEIQSQEPLTIEGQVEGKIEIGDHLLTVAAGASVRAQIVGRSIEVHGRVEGQLEAEQTVYIRKDAEFVGDIHACSLVIEEGAYIKGQVELAREAAEPRHERVNAA